MRNTRIELMSAFIAIAVMLFVGACSGPATNSENPANTDSLDQKQKDSLAGMASATDTIAMETEKPDAATAKAEQPTVLVYNFYVTNRCAACKAIEDATTKTLNTYFAKEFKQGRIRRYILNVDNDANKAVSEKYEAFGSGIVVTRVFKGKETTTDLTGDGFKYAKNKEEKFIEILKNKITEYLK